MKRFTHRSAALVLPLLLVAGATALAGEASAGDVTGTVTFAGEVPRIRPIRMDADPQCAEKHDGPVASRTLILGPAGAEGEPTLANVFVQIVGATATTRTPKEPVVVDQVGCLYEPRIVGVRAGQPLLFRNSDGIFHNVHLKPSKNEEQNVAMPAFLKEKETTLSEPELYVPVTCDVHPWMRAYVAVMDHPYFDITGTDGVFTIDDVPQGPYTVRAWHEKLGVAEARVIVPPVGEATVDLSFERPQ